MFELKLISNGLYRGKNKITERTYIYPFETLPLIVSPEQMANRKSEQLIICDSSTKYPERAQQIAISNPGPLPCKRTHALIKTQIAICWALRPKLNFYNDVF